MKTMWSLLDRVSELERRVGAVYDLFAQRFRGLPLVASLWRELAEEERMHALIVAAAREVFPPTAPVPPGDWRRQLAAIAKHVEEAEQRARADLTLREAFTCAEEIEASELNAVTAAILERAGSGFSRLGPLAAGAGVDRHRDKVLQAYRRFCTGSAGRRDEEAVSASDPVVARQPARSRPGD
jgi:hypothetical protein